MVDRRRPMLVTKLPPGYKRLEYIRNTTTAWIDSKYSFASDNSSILDVTFRVNTRGDWARIAGNFSTNEGKCMMVRLNTSKTPIQVLVIQNASHNSNEWVTADIELNKIVNVHVEYNNSSVNGIPLEQKANSGDNASTKFGVFTNGGIRYFLGDIFSCYLIHNGKMALNFIPCINPNEIVGMYETVNGVFYKSSGNNAEFEAGPVIYETENEVSWIPSSGYKGMTNNNDEIVNGETVVTTTTTGSAIGYFHLGTLEDFDPAIYNFSNVYMTGSKSIALAVVDENDVILYWVRRTAIGTIQVNLSKYPTAKRVYFSYKNSGDLPVITKIG